jgi:hypothetical protein
MEFGELPKRMIGCAIAVHWHLRRELKDRIERFFLCYLRALRALRGPPIAASRSSAMGTFRDRGEQVGVPERANNSVLNRKDTRARWPWSLEGPGRRV